MEHEVEHARAELVREIAERHGARDAGRLIGLGRANKRREDERGEDEPDLPAMLEMPQVEQRQADREREETTDETEDAKAEDEALHPWLSRGAALGRTKSQSPAKSADDAGERRFAFLVSGHERDLLTLRWMRSALVVVLFAAACETGGGSTAVDAAPDVAVPPVVTLNDCPSVVAATIEDSPTMFVPKETTINKGQTVKFVITAEHFVIPNTLTTTDSMLSVKRGETKCFRFNTAGVYGFLCGVHGFTGTITVN